MARPVSTPLQLINERVLAEALSDITGLVGKTLDQFTNSRTSKQLISFFEALSQEPGRALAAEKHAELAKMMQDSVKRSWNASRGKLRPAIYNPTRTSRYSGGIDKIVNADYLVRSDANGVQFGPIAEMNKDAEQWARINYGALPTGQGTQRSYPVRFSNLPAIEFVIDEPARPGYGLPQGAVLSGFKGPDGKWQREDPGDRSGAFYPKAGSTQQKMTKGNAAFHMLDAGIARFFAEFPKAYGDLFRDVLAPGQRRGRPPTGLERRTIR